MQLYRLLSPPFFDRSGLERSQKNHTARGLQYLRGLFPLLLTLLTLADAKADEQSWSIADGFLRIDAIRFYGNSSIDEEDLMAVIRSEASAYSWLERQTLFYARSFARHPLMPRRTQSLLRQPDEALRHKQRFLDVQTVKQDLAEIIQLYNARGFHHTRVQYSLRRRALSGEIELQFHIDEGWRAVIDTIVVRGVDHLPAEPRAAIEAARTIRRNELFDERRLALESARLCRALRDHGYYFARPDTPNFFTVSHFAERASDSITLRLATGKRQILAALVFADSTFDRICVDSIDVIRKMALPTRGWYSHSAVEKAVLTLQQMGTFRRVRIDTLSGHPLKSDSSLVLCVELLPLRAMEVDIAGVYSHSREEDISNFGLSAGIEHRNLWCLAHQARLHTVLELRDIAALLSNQRPPELEYAVAFDYAIPRPPLWPERGPLEFSLKASRIRINSTALADDFILQTLKLQLGMPFMSFLNVNGFLSLDLRNELPISFGKAYDAALAANPRQREQIRRQLFQYRQLDRIAQNEQPVFTSAFARFSFAHSLLDNAQSPANGHALSLAFDLGAQREIADVLRLNTNVEFYRGLMPDLVWANRLRLGHVFWKDETVAYLPPSLHFFAGGAHSVRAWPSRGLRAERDLDGGALTDYVGSGSLLLATSEVRWTLVSPRRDFLQRPVSARWGLTTFFDLGNTSNDLAGDVAEYRYGLGEAFDAIGRNLAVAGGFGLWCEFPDFPPLRLDLATRILDPAREHDALLFDRPLKSWPLRWQIALGHAF